MELTNGHKLSKVIQRRFDYCRHMSVIDWMGLEITVNIKVRNDPVTVLSYNVVLIDGTPRRSYCLHLLFTRALVPSCTPSSDYPHLRVQDLLALSF
jgi:hypothetical protein